MIATALESSYDVYMPMISDRVVGILIFILDVVISD